MANFIRSLSRAADLIRDLAFLKILLTVLLLVGVALLVKWGVRGIADQRTYIFGRWAGGVVRYGEVEGIVAIVVGVLHLCVASIVAATLGPLCYFLWFR